MEEVELKSPPACTNTVTVRRNPIRRVRATPSSIIPLPLPLSSPFPSIPHNVPPFPVEDILSIEVPKIETEPDRDSLSENLKVFLRIRPLAVQKTVLKEGKRAGNVWPRNPKSKDVKKEKEKKGSEICVKVIDNHSVIVSPPLDLQGTKRFKSEVYEGFSSVFSADSSQSEVYEKMVSPLVKDLLNGKSGVLAALGPSGSGKTHTVFGCARDPGMVPRVLRQIFTHNESSETHLARTFHLSMFEICSEKGKSERLSDLLQEGFVYMQQSTIKGLKEVIITEAQQAESAIACGMLKRATATTNSNSQSSRSQCIINIRRGPKKVDGETEDESSNAVLTIVDLAGAEREKKTGNQGLRLLESNFINNTSMVFGLCLRSLLEHQKNPKKQLQKNFQNSLLTRYLKPYLEGKKRMALVLTVKPGEEDYLDTSNLLKQASPFSQIRFSSTEEPGNSKCAKRPSQTSQREENKKRMKFNGMEADVIDERTMDEKQQTISSEKVEDDHLAEISVKSEANGLVNLERNPIEAARREREHQIMVHMSKALWNVLKQYKQKLKVADNELNCLRVTLANEQKIRVDLENEVKDLKCQISHLQEASNEQVEAASNIHYEDVERLRDSRSSEAGDLNSISGARAICTDLDGLVSQESEESAENATSITDTRDFKTDVEEEDHLINENAEDVEQLQDSNSSEASDLNSIGGATEICTDQDGLVSQECEESAENAASIIDTREFKIFVDEEGHLNNETAEDVEQLRDPNSSEAGYLNSIGGTTAVCTDRDGLVSQESEESAENATSIIDTIDFKNDVEEESHLNNESVEDVLVLRVEDSFDSSPESWVTDHSESSVSSSELCATTTGSSPLLAAEMDKLAQKDCEKEVDLLVKVSFDGKQSLTKGREDCKAPDIASIHVGCEKFENLEKRKRRLLPVSSILLKDMGSLALEDANDKLKGTKGERKVSEDMKNKSKGSLSLLRLLRNDLDR